MKKLFALGMFGGAAAPAAALNITTVPSPNGLDTIWTVGDYDLIADAFQAVAMIFGGGAPESVMQSLLVLAAMIGVVVVAVSSILKIKMDIMGWVLMMFIMGMFFMVKTDVKFASYYNATGSVAAGAVAFKKVDNVPIGLAWPTAMTSFIGKKITEIYDTNFQLLSNTRITGGVQIDGGSFLVNGAEGFFSPLKVALRMHNRFSPSDKYWVQNLRSGMESCGWKDMAGMYSSHGVFGVLMAEKQTGKMKYTFDHGGARQTKDIYCNVAGYAMSLQLVKDVMPSSQGFSHSAKVAGATSSLSTPNSNPSNQTGEQKLAHMQSEAELLPKMLVSGLGGSDGAPNGFGTPDAMLTTIHNEIMAGRDHALSVAQGIMTQNEVYTSTVMASMLANNIMANCYNGSNGCGQFQLLMGDAGQKALIDAAGEASMFQRFAGHAMNVLLFVFAAMSPIIIFLMMLMGQRGFRLGGSYLMFCAWISSWLPLINAIAYYMAKKYINGLSDAMAVLSVGGDKKLVMSPTVINQILLNTQDAIATSATMMSSAPLIMLSLMSGSIYGMVQLAQRASMTGKDHMDESKVVPDLSRSGAVNMAARMQANQGVSADGIVQNDMINSDRNASVAGLQGVGASTITLGHATQETFQKMQQAQVAKSFAAQTSFMNAVGSNHVNSSGVSEAWGMQVGENKIVSFGRALEGSDAESFKAAEQASGGVRGAAGLSLGAMEAKTYVDKMHAMGKDATIAVGVKDSTGETVGKSLTLHKDGSVTFAGQHMSMEQFTKSFTETVAQQEQIAESASRSLSGSMSNDTRYTYQMGDTARLLDDAERKNGDESLTGRMNEIVDKYLAPDSAQARELKAAIATGGFGDDARLIHKYFSNQGTTQEDIGARLAAAEIMKEALVLNNETAAAGYLQAGLMMSEQDLKGNFAQMYESGQQKTNMAAFDAAKDNELAAAQAKHSNAISSRAAGIQNEYNTAQNQLEGDRQKIASNIQGTIDAVNAGKTVGLLHQAIGPGHYNLNNLSQSQLNNFANAARLQFDKDHVDGGGVPSNKMSREDRKAYMEAREAYVSERMGDIGYANQPYTAQEIKAEGLSKNPRSAGIANAGAPRLNDDKWVAVEGAEAQAKRDKADADLRRYRDAVDGSGAGIKARANELLANGNSSSVNERMANQNSAGGYSLGKPGSGVSNAGAAAVLSGRNPTAWMNQFDHERPDSGSAGAFPTHKGMKDPTAWMNQFDAPPAVSSGGAAYGTVGGNTAMDTMTVMADPRMQRLADAINSDKYYRARGGKGQIGWHDIGTKSESNCGFAVGSHLTRAGLHPYGNYAGLGNGKDVAGSLIRSGKWEKVAFSKDMQFQHGDVISFPNPDKPGHPGHVAIYDATKGKWVSDFVQHRKWGAANANYEQAIASGRIVPTVARHKDFLGGVETSQVQVASSSGPSRSGGFNMGSMDANVNVVKGSGFTKEKGEIIARVARNIGADPNDLAAVISFETMGTFSPSIKNKGSSALGLIQFLATESSGKERWKNGRPKKDLYYGMTESQFANLSFEKQMGYVERYFLERGFRADKPRSVADVYGAVTGHGYRAGTDAYELNKVWDADGNGVVTKGEMVKSDKFRKHQRRYFG